MKVKDMMTLDVKSVSSNDTIYFSINKMADHDIGFLPVIDNEELKGVFTDRDVILALADDFTLKDAAKDIMVSDVITVNEEASESEATTIMGSNQVRRLVVMNNSNKVVGILTLRDLVNFSTHEDELFATLEEISSELSNLSDDSGMKKTLEEDDENNKLN